MNNEPVIEEYEIDGKKGVIVRDKNGHFMPGTQSHHQITHDNARLMVNKRINKYREMAAERLGRDFAAIDPEVCNTPVQDQPAAAYALLVSRTAQQAYDSEIPRADALREVGRSIGATVEDNEIIDNNDRTQDIILRLADLVTGELENRIKKDR